MMPRGDAHQVDPFRDTCPNDLLPEPWAVSPGGAVGVEWARGAFRRDGMKFRIVIEQDEDGVFVANCPGLQGCHSQGATRSETKANIQEAIEGYLEGFKEHGDCLGSWSVDDSPQHVYYK